MITGHGRTLRPTTPPLPGKNVTSADRSAYRFRRTISIIAFAFAISPIVVSFVASGISDLLGCGVSAAGPGVCTVMGIDIGGLLTSAFLLHWGAIITLPIGMLVGFIFLVAAGFTKVAEDRGFSAKGDAE